MRHVCLAPPCPQPCHAAPVSSLAVVGGVLYSASHDMSIVPWLEPTREPDAKDPAKYKTVQVSTTPPDESYNSQVRSQVTGHIEKALVGHPG